MHFPCGETLPPAFDPVLFYNFIFLNSLGFFFVVVVVRFPLASYFFFLSFCCCCEAKEPIGGEGVRPLDCPAIQLQHCDVRTTRTGRWTGKEGTTKEVFLSTLKDDTGRKKNGRSRRRRGRRR